MTAGPAENAAAAAAVAAGEAAAAKHDGAALAQHQASGSTVVAEQPSTPDDTAVQWSQPHGIVSGVSPQPTRSPNVSTPHDNSQSQ